MKKITSFLTILTLAFVAITPSQADDNITLNADIKSSTNTSGKGEEKTNVRYLEISATGFHLAQPTPVRIEWILFGDDLSNGSIVRKGEGSESLQLSQSKYAIIKTKPTAFVYTPRHTERSGNGRRAKFRTVEATGVRYHGWSLRAFVGEKLVGKAVSNNALNKLLEPAP